MEKNVIYNCWLSPEGEVFECEFWEHIKIAEEIIKAKGWEKEFEEFWPLKASNDNMAFLYDVKGFQRLHSHSIASKREWIIGRRPTQLQIDKMYELTGFLEK